MGRKLSIPDLSGINRGLRVLFVEDDQNDAKIVMDVLTKDRRIEAAKWVDSVEAATHSLKNDAWPDLIITDLGLPDQNGIELLKLIRSVELSYDNRDLFDPEKDKYTPVVVLTDSDLAVDFHSASEANGNCFVTKPDQIGELRDLLRNLVRSVIWGKELPQIMTAAAASQRTAI